MTIGEDDVHAAAVVAGRAGKVGQLWIPVGGAAAVAVDAFLIVDVADRAADYR